MQLSASKILGFLINDMLDYAQLSAGKFRKVYSSLNLFNSVKDILAIMKFKADEFGINIEVDMSKINERYPQIYSGDGCD